MQHSVDHNAGHDAGHKKGLRTHLIPEKPRKPPFCVFSHVHSGCALSPLTSTFFVSGNVV